MTKETYLTVVGFVDVSRVAENEIMEEETYRLTLLSFWIVTSNFDKIYGQRHETQGVSIHIRHPFTSPDFTTVTLCCLLVQQYSIIVWFKNAEMLPALAMLTLLSLFVVITYFLIFL